MSPCFSTSNFSVSLSHTPGRMIDLDFWGGRLDSFLGFGGFERGGGGVWRGEGTLVLHWRTMSFICLGGGRVPYISLGHFQNPSSGFRPIGYSSISQVLKDNY